MKLDKRVIGLIFFLIIKQNSFSQENVDSLYGLNPFLYNGQLYTYYIPASVSGNQYLHHEDFVAGSVHINQMHFDEVLLNYDIYNQELVLSFKLNQRLFVIKLFKDRINNFLIGNEYFELIPDEQSDYIIYQVIGDGDFKILYHWKKWLKISSGTKSGTYSFTKPLKTMYLKTNKQVFKFKNTRAFLSLMEESKKQQIKKYLKQNKINVKKASDNELVKLIDLCNSL